MRNTFAFLLLLLCVTIASSQSLKTFHLKFEKEGSRKAWIAADNSTESATEDIDASKTDTEIAAPDNINAKAVYVRDLKTNKVAQNSLLNVLKAGSWSPKPEDFSKTYELKFTVANAKGPVAGGVLSVQSNTPDNATRTVLIDDSMNGAGSIYLLFGTEASITYTTKIDGKEVTTDPQTVDLKATEVQTIAIVAPADAPIIQTATQDPTPKQGEPVTASEATTPPTPSAPAVNPLQTLINMVIALAIIGGLGYAAWWYTQNNQGKVEELVKKAGLDPKDKQADPTGALPIVPEKSAPLKKIVLDPTAATTANTAVSPNQTAIIPKLVATNGSTTTLSEGNTTVGRESADLIISNNSSISRAHAQLSRNGAIVTLTDLGSTNGTYVNGTKIEGPTVLNPGDTILFGNAHYQFEG